MRKRAGSSSPAEAASRMRTATCVLLVNARSPGLRDSQASSNTDCSSFSVSGLSAFISDTPHTHCRRLDSSYRPLHARYTSALCGPSFSSGRHAPCACRPSRGLSGIRASMRSLWTIRSSEQFCTDSLFEFEEKGRFETPTPSAQCFASTLKIFADRVSSNRTEHASGEGNVHAFSICVAQIQAADAPADKPVPGVRRRDHSCRD